MTLRLVLAVLVAALAVGCANVTTTKILRGHDGSLAISSGKDVKIDKLTFDPTSGAISVEGYSSNANVAVIDAEAEREAMHADKTLAVLQAGAALALKGAAAAGGIPIP